MIGHSPIEKAFRKLVDGGRMSHSYIFFGDSQVGKRSFAVRLASYLETGRFEESSRPLSELSFIRPTQIEELGEWSIRIDEVRKIKNFLYQKPVNSNYRVALIDNAELLTDDAQDALLKIAEEPPPHALIILVVANPETLLKTLQSRFQKIYFPVSKRSLISKMLVADAGLDAAEAERIARLSFGRPGRAMDLVRNDELKKVREEAVEILKSRAGMKELVAHLADAENKDKVNDFLAALIAELSIDARKNLRQLKALIVGFSRLNEWNVNRKIQLGAALSPLFDEPR